ncbi:MAG: oligopeptide transporter ATP-binding protein [Devosia sp.]|uniref:ABC transporter ATP-binding protein n=1 Tax=Devosia sp. TaxID=1871048 RepID=UPI00261E7DD9|nr:ABC transporter ATP-binding protein [Devosia sp.]MDB5539707.1 oligopeptide transporter ATP-binding protein [Devosia sp.]
MGEPVLEIKNLRVGFRTEKGMLEIIHDIDLHIDRGETLVVLGESGSGKSVTASTIMDLLDRPPAEILSGEVLLHGQDLLKLSDRERQQINGKKIAIVFQDPLAHLHPLYTIGRQIAEVLTVHGTASGSHAWKTAEQLLERVGIPDPQRRAHQYPHQFSGGQRQRVMIAMALATRPELMIADEPTTALDVTVQAEILSLLRELTADFGMAVMLITHDLSVAANMGDRVAVMQQGRIVETGETRAVFEHPQHSYTKRLLDARPDAMASTKEAPVGAPQLLRVEHLTKDYYIPGGLRSALTIHAVKDVSFTVARGETLAIVGESGSGKSTVARLLMLLDSVTSGEIFYRGEDLLKIGKKAQFKQRRRMQMVFQDPYSSLNPGMSVGRIISEPWTVHTDILPKSRRAERLAELLTLVGLSPDHASRYPHEFSGGQRQRIAIARALACEPELIICDEAVSSLDLSIQAQMIELLTDLRDRLGLSYLFISHDLHLVRHFANRVLVMKSGDIVEQGQTNAVFSRPEKPYTKQLVNATPRPKWDRSLALQPI